MPSPSTVTPARFRSAIRRPRTIEVAFWITLGAMALYVIFAVTVGIATAVRTGTPISPGAAVINLSIAVAPMTVMIVFARLGERWARGFFTLGAVLVLIKGLLLVIDIVRDTPEDALSFVAFSIAVVVLQTAPAVLLCLPTSNAYFRAVAAEKRAFRQSILR